MSLRLVHESFCYGNIKNLHIKQETDFFSKSIVNFLKTNTKDRPLDTFWCLVVNIRSITNVHSIDFLKFVKEIFDILDQRFQSDYSSVSFDNIAILKAFIVNNITYAIDSYSFSTNPIAKENLTYYLENFKNILEYIDKFKIITNYNINSASEELWSPKWRINYNDNELSTSNIDIFIDNLITEYNIEYLSNMTDVLKKIHNRLTFLKDNASMYFEFISTFLYDFSKHVFYEYPYYEIANNYQDLIKISDQIYIPSEFNRTDFEYLDILFYTLPLNFISYILGFPVTTMGSLPRHLIKEFTKYLKDDPDKYFKDLEEKNDNYIKSKMFIKKCGNSIEDDKILNLIYTPVNSYNSDDTIVLFSNGVYFVFNYPEYDNIIKNESNPYNREIFDFKYISSFSFAKSMKKDMVKEVRVRGLEIDLKDTMVQNFEEFRTKIKFFKPIQNNYTSNNKLNVIFRHFTEEFAS